MTDLRILLAPTTRLIGAVLLTASVLAPVHAQDAAAKPAAGASKAATPAEEPSTLILSDTLHVDKENRTQHLE